MNGWRIVKLGDIAEVQSGGTPNIATQSYWNGDIPWYSSGELNNLYTAPPERQISPAGLAGSNAKVFPKGSLLIGMYDTAALKMSILDRDASFNQAIAGVKFNECIDLYFVLHAINSVRDHILGQRRGVRQKNLNLGIIRNLELNLPPLPEQRRIADILDKAEALRIKRREALAELDGLAQAIFIDMFGDPVTNPKGWDETKLLGEIADIVSGVTKGRKTNGKATRSVPYLAVANVQDKSLCLSAIKTIEATEDEIKRFRLMKYDLLLTEGGDPDKLGRGTLWNDELPECIHQNHIFRVRLKNTTVNPLYLNWIVGSQRGKKYFLQSAKQTTGIASINMTQLRGFPLLLPPLQLQDEFSLHIAALEDLKTSHRASLTELDALFSSLQHRAFRGEL